MKLIICLLFFLSISNAQSTDTIQVHTGWNMIGALYTGTISDIVSTLPPYIIISPFFGYSPSYYETDSLIRGNGYWVKVNQDGKILMANSVPFTCGAQISYEGGIYNTVQIGSQCWLKENLNVGTMINGSSNATNNGIIEKYCYNNNPSNCNTYGGLYQWNETMQYTTIPGTRGICPSGWHIPTIVEYQTLSNSVGGDGNALKAIGQGVGGGAGTNTSGFSALLSGYRQDAVTFNNLGYHANLWSSTGYDGATAYGIDLHYNNNAIDSFNHIKDYGFSVRCLKD